MTNFRVAGQRLEFTAEGVLVNGRPAKKIVELQNGWSMIVDYFYRHVRPKKASGARKRRKSLKASAKRYRFSFKLKKEM